MRCKRLRATTAFENVKSGWGKKNRRIIGRGATWKITSFNYHAAAGWRGRPCRVQDELKPQNNRRKRAIAAIASRGKPKGRGTVKQVDNGGTHDRAAQGEDVP